MATVLVPLVPLALAALAAAAPPQDAPQDAPCWPGFRGAHARGVADGPELPVTWSLETGRNVDWRTPVAGLAHSSPVVWGRRVFVTTAVRAGGDSELSSLYGSPGYGAGEAVAQEGAHEMRVLCFDLETGALLWSRTAYAGVPAIGRHPKSTHANSTPACDGERVVAFFGSEGLYCYDHEGELLWKRDFGTLDAGAPGRDDPTYQWGFASSPVLHAGRVIVQCDVQGQSFLAALDARTGEEVWWTARDEDPTWCTPTVHVGAGRAQVIANGYRHAGGYDLATGAELWKIAGGGDVPVPTPIVADGIVYLTSSHGRSRPIWAIRADAQGLVTADEACADMLWHEPRRGIYMQTPLVHDDLLYACSDGGVLACLRAKTGEMLYRERLNDGTSGYSASAVASNGKLWFTGESGEVVVVRAGPEFEVLARNELGETCLATPAIANGRLLFRTRGHLLALRARD